MTVAAQHNGGRYQIGLNFLQIGNDFPFLNHLKTAQSYSYVDNTAPPTPDELDTNGYLKAGANAIAHGGVYSICYIPTQAERAGRYKITWTGNGTIYLASATTGVIGSKTGSGGSGSYEFSLTDFRISIGHTTGGNVSNMKLFHVDDEAAVLAGEVFGVKFKARIAESKCGVLRFMDWQPGNTTNVTTWATRRPIGYAYYSGPEYRESMWAGVTTNSGDAYTAPLTPSSWLGLVDKATVIVHFNASATGDAATLNVAGTGPIAIRKQDGDATSSGSNSRPITNTMGLLVYDATLNAWLKHGGDTTGRIALNNGVPYELMVQLAAETGCHPYFVTPYLSIDPATDFMGELAKYIKTNYQDTVAPWMVPRYEITNETWNNASGFYATRYAWNKATAYWSVSFGHNNWVGKIASVLGQIISSVYGGDRSKYWLLLGVQTAGGTSVNERLTSTSYVGQAAAAQSPLTGSWGTTTFTKSAAYNWVTYVCVANYITGVPYSTLQELRDGYAYTVTYAADSVTQATLAAAYANALGDASGPYNVAYLATLYVNWYAWAHGPWGGSVTLGLTCYEGGYSPDYSSTVWTSPITGATQANPCVLTLATTSGTRGAIAGGGTPAVVGMSVSIASVVGMTQLNGNTYTVTAVAGNAVTINVDASGFSAWTSGGTASYVNSPLYTNTLRYASKFSSFIVTYTMENFKNFVAAGGEFPSIFIFSASSTSADRNQPIGGQVWGVWDPSIWTATPSAAWDGMVLFGGRKRRFAVTT